MKQKPFVAMKGSEIMEFVRDALLDEAARKKGFIDDCEKVAGGVTPPEDRQRVRTLEAAGEMLTYVIVVGQDERAKCDKDAARRFPDWIWKLSSELRRLLVAEEVDPENETAG
jgi:hypothetical protein